MTHPSRASHDKYRDRKAGKLEKHTVVLEGKKTLQLRDNLAERSSTVRQCNFLGGERNIDADFQGAIATSIIACQNRLSADGIARNPVIRMPSDSPRMEAIDENLGRNVAKNEGRRWQSLLV